MTVRRWMVAVALVATWLAFVARADRLRKVAANHMRQVAHRSRADHANDGRRPGDPRQADARAAWHLKMATEYNVEADFVEAFQLAVLLTLLTLGAGVFLQYRRRAATAGASTR